MKHILLLFDPYGVSTLFNNSDCSFQLMVNQFLLMVQEVYQEIHLIIFIFKSMFLMIYNLRGMICKRFVKDLKLAYLLINIYLENQFHQYYQSYLIFDNALKISPFFVAEFNSSSCESDHFTPLQPQSQFILYKKLINLHLQSKSFTFSRIKNSCVSCSIQISSKIYFFILLLGQHRVIVAYLIHCYQFM